MKKHYTPIILTALALTLGLSVGAAAAGPASTAPDDLDCSALRALTILKNIRNPLIFLRKMASYSCFWRVPRLKIFMQASLHQISNLLTLVSCHLVNTMEI